MHRFHFHTPVYMLKKKDFTLFHSLFVRSMANRFLSFSELVFITDVSQLENFFQDTKELSNIKDKVAKALSGQSGIQKYGKGILLPFPVEGSTVVAVVKGMDPFLLKKAAPDWLFEMRDSLLYEFALIKQANIDLETGLPNLSHLHHVLDSCEKQKELHLMLIELYPRARSANDALLHSRKATLALRNFFNNKVLLHHLGQGVFAIVTNQYQKETLSRMGASLMSWLRRDRFKRVHVGCSHSSDLQFTDCTDSRKKTLLDQAWVAVRTASKRGPFSYCDYAHLSQPENHPLRRPSRKILARFQRKWKCSELFSIVQLKVDDAENFPLFKKCILGFDKNLLVHDGDDIYVFLDGMQSDEASHWIVQELEKINETFDPEISISLGIATFPFINFKKSEIVLNCRKALLHAAFFGPGSKAIFDPVSLNISGDIFYGDGDFPKAIKEYRRGLLGDENNINLLNSLGSAYGVIEKQKEALHCFQKVLKIDQNNFMALYNLGIGEEYIGMDGSALSRFEKAITVSTDEKETAGVKSDLFFQLGRLYCRAKNYKKSIDVLLPWYLQREGEGSAGRALKYLGKSFYFSSHDYKEAMRWLQKAMQFDEFDAASMGLLGIVYLEGGEGNDIALSLCTKSVELDPQNIELRLKLARVLVVCGLLIEAKNHLRKCAGNRKTKTEAQFQLGLVYEKEGKLKNARLWFAKLLADNVKDKEIVQHIRKFYEVNPWPIEIA